MPDPNDIYGSISGSSEPNIRQEMINTLDGFYPEIGKSQPGIIRKMNVAADGSLIRCPCVDPITHEPDKDYFCGICYGERYIWNESLTEFYKVIVDADGQGGSSVWNRTKDYGLVNIAVSIFYFKYNVDLQKHDKIVEVSLDLEGGINQPIKRTTIWRINEVISFRADNGRVEYLKVFGTIEDVKYLEPPQGT